MQAVQQGNANTALRMRKAMQQEVERMRQREMDTRGNEVMLHALDAQLAMMEGDLARAESLMQQAVAIEDAMPFTYGPPWPTQPAHELYGEVLIKAEHYTEALKQFRASMERYPKRRLSIIGMMTAQHHLCNIRV